MAIKNTLGKVTMHQLSWMVSLVGQRDGEFGLPCLMTTWGRGRLWLWSESSSTSGATSAPSPNTVGAFPPTSAFSGISCKGGKEEVGGLFPGKVSEGGWCTWDQLEGTFEVILSDDLIFKVKKLRPRLLTGFA